MYRVYVDGDGQTVGDLLIAFEIAASAHKARVVDSDEYTIRADWMFTDGRLFVARVNVGGKLQTVRRNHG